MEGDFDRSRRIRQLVGVTDRDLSAARVVRPDKGIVIGFGRDFRVGERSVALVPFHFGDVERRDRLNGLFDGGVYVVYVPDWHVHEEAVRGRIRTNRYRHHHFY